MCFPFAKYPYFIIFFMVGTIVFTDKAFGQNTLPDSVYTRFFSKKNTEQRLLFVLEQASEELNANLSNCIAAYGVYLADSLKDSRKLAEAYEIYGISFNKKGDYSSAIENLGKAVQLYEQMNSKEDVAKIKRTMGETFRASKNYTLAMEYLNQSLSYFTKRKDDVMLARIYNRMAATLYELWYVGENSVFGEIISKNPSLNYLEKINLEPELRTLNDSLVNSLKLSISYASKANRNDLIISSNIIQGSYLVSTFQYEQANSLFEKTGELIEREKLYEDLALIYLNWSRLYSIGYLGEPVKAIALAKKALQIAIEQDIPVYRFMANNTIHANYAFIGDYENAYFYLMEQVPLIEDYGEKDLLSQLKTLEYQFELQESERALETKRYQLQIILVGILIIISIATIFILILKRNINRQKELLKILNQKSEIILKQNGELEQINAEKDRFFAILAHDLKGPIKAISASLALIKEDLELQRYDEAKQMTIAISDSATKASELLSNLIEWAKSQRGKIKVNAQDTDVQLLVKNSLDLLQEIYTKKEIIIDNQLIDPIPIHTDKEILATVIRNVLSNAIKYSHVGGVISITCKEAGPNLELHIQDFGIGMNEKMIQSLFKIDSNNNRPGTAGEVSSGLGLILCKDFISYIDGTITIQSIPLEGTHVRITFPKNHKTFS